MFKSIKIPDNFSLSKRQQREYEKAKIKALYYAMKEFKILENERTTNISK